MNSLLAGNPRMSVRMFLPGIQLAAVGLLIFVLAYGGIALTRDEGRIAALWVPNAVLAAIILRSEPKRSAHLLLAGFTGNVLANLQVGDVLMHALGMSTANTIEISLLCRFLQLSGIGSPKFTRHRHIVGFALAAATSAAIAGLAATMMLYPASFDEGLAIWWKWTRADALGLILFVPALTIILDALKSGEPLARAKLVEAVAIILFGTSISVMTFWQSSYPFLFLDAPLVLLYALRLGSVGNAIAIINLAIVATCATWNGYGPITLVKGDLGEKLMVLQLFLASSFAVGLPFAALLASKKESELRFRRLAEAAPLGIFEIDRAGRVAYVNSAGRAIADDGTDDGNLPKWAARLRGALLQAGSSEACSVNETFTRSDGRKVHTKIVFNACDDAETAEERVIGVIADITSEIEMAQELSAAKRTFQVLADLSPAGIFRTERDGTLDYVNRAWLEVSGLTAEQARGEGWASAVHLDDVERVYVGWHDAVRRKIPYRGDFRFCLGNGKVNWVDAMAVPEMDDEGEVCGFVGVLMNISHRKRMEETLWQERERAQKASHAKAEFLANMSHEIRTPMNGVLGFADLLLGQELTHEQRRFTEAIADSAEAMMTLLNDILDISKIEAGKLELAHNPVDIRHKIESCLRVFEPMAREKGIELVQRVDADVPQVLDGDPMRVRQILINLIGNAVKFTKEGAVRINVGLESCPLAPPRLRIDIADTGIGIAPAKIEQIFEEFGQADSSTSREFGGTGLGLTISSRLARMMEGEITVASTPGQGSTFSLLLPTREIDDRRLLSRPAEPVKVDPIKGQTVRALIAEDHDINQVLILEMAKQAGIEADLAIDGVECVALVERSIATGNPYQILFMDVQMPGMDGLEATRKIREMGIGPEQLPIIALTANCYAEDIQRCMKAGMQGHLAKPLKLELLLEALVRHARRDESAAAPNPAPNSTPATPAARPGVSTKLRQKYELRKRQTLADVAAALLSNGVWTWDALIQDLHKLAGTAGMFGDEALGVAVRDLERALKEAADDAARAAALHETGARLLQTG